jgi:hypothetical protein
LKRDGIRALAWIETPISLNYLQQIFQQPDAGDIENTDQQSLCQEIVRVLGRVNKAEMQGLATEILVNLLNHSQIVIQRFKFNN